MQRPHIAAFASLLVVGCADPTPPSDGEIMLIRTQTLQIAGVAIAGAQLVVPLDPDFFDEITSDPQMRTSRVSLS